jgi:alpha-beta hydrolase superfamily lysophospholipase
VVIVHGYAEHSGRYEWVGARLAEAGFAAHAYDLRGHGRSDGPRATVRSFREHLGDLESLLAIVRDESGDRPLFLLGHSMGGCVVALEAAIRQPDVRGIILSGPAVGEMPRAMRLVLPILGLIARARPGIGLRTLAAADVSRDPAVVEAYDHDPLVYRGRMPVGTVAAIGRSIRRIHRDAANIHQPILFLHGTNDALVDAQASQVLYERVSSPDRTLKLYEGLSHEVLNEPEREQVMADVLSWLEQRA